MTTSVVTAIVLLAVLILFATRVAAVARPRQQWEDATRYLVARTNPRDGFFPSFGNGFISGDAGCGEKPACPGPNNANASCGLLHVGGVFNVNGNNHLKTANIPARAGIANPFSVVVESTELQRLTFDLRLGMFVNTTTVNCKEGHSAVVESRTYAHRRIRSLLVFELVAQNLPAGSSCTISLSSCSIPSVADFQKSASPQSPLIGTESLIVKKVEQPPYAGLPSPPRTEVGVAWTKLPRELTLSTENASASTASQLFIASYRTSLETEVGIGRAATFAEDDVQKYSAFTAADLLESHEQAWDEIWQGGIELEGNVTFAATVNSSLFYILSSVRADWPYGMSPGGIARNDYEGHAFWDMETWMFPNLVALYPHISESIVQYRLARLPAAQKRAQHHGCAGGMQPWESALLGYGVSSWKDADNFEIHITGDVAMAVRLLYRMSGNRTWLRTAWPLVKSAAEYFASRFITDPETGNYTLLYVIPPDEKAHIVNGSAYTNAVAAETLRFGVEAGKLLGIVTPSNWTTIPLRIYMQMIDVEGFLVHAEYDGYSVEQHPYINQADVALLQYPLNLPMNRQIAENDLRFYQERSSGPQTAGFYTGDSAYSIAWLQLGNRSMADAQLNLAFQHMDLGHFNVWTEKSFGDFGNLNFLTGAGGYVQNILYGYAGLRYSDGELHLQPVLPPLGITRMRLRRLALSTGRFTVTVDSRNITVELQSDSASESRNWYVRSGHYTRALHLGRPILVASSGDGFQIFEDKPRLPGSTAYTGFTTFIVATVSAVMLAGVVGLYLHSRSRSRRRLPPYHAEDAGYVEADF